MSQAKQLMTVKEIAAYAGVHPRTVTRWRAAGLLGVATWRRGERGQQTQLFERARVDRAMHRDRGQLELDLGV